MNETGSQSTPFISVLIPTCNRHEDLDRCLQRLDPQIQQVTTNNYEVVVSDDGLPAVDIVAKYAYARWVQGPKRGPAANRNAAAANAQGELFVFTDDDCLPEPGWLSAFREAAHDSRLAVWEGRTTVDYPLKGPFYFAPANEEGGFLWSCNMAIRKSTFEELQGFDENFPYAFLEDVDFRKRLVSRGIRFAFVPTALVVHPQRHVGGIIAELKKYESYFYMSRKYNASLAECGFGPYFFLQYKKQQLTRSRNAIEVASIALRAAAEAAVLVVLTPKWEAKYRCSRTP